jgi:hypothetical protein
MTARAAALLVLFPVVSKSVLAQSLPPDPAPPHACDVDLDHVGQMKDILSNALMRELHFEESRVRTYLDVAQSDCANGADLLRKSAAEFAITESDLVTHVERYRHINCFAEGADPEVAVDPDSDPPLSQFAKDVTLHVILHELGHALIREFDLPVLGNEETAADAFATHYLTQHLPDRALDALQARVASLMFEANAVSRNEWKVRGEHDSDARRAYQIAALAIAADPERYRPVALAVGMSEDEISDSRDYGAEIHRSWRRILRPLWMPAGLESSEARLAFDSESGLVGDLRASSLPAELEAAVRDFDWHSQVTIRFTVGAGGAAWNRSERTITVHSGYVRRFVEQGESIAESNVSPKSPPR